MSPQTLGSKCQVPLASLQGRFATAFSAMRGDPELAPLAHPLPKPRCLILYLFPQSCPPLCWHKAQFPLGRVQQEKGNWKIINNDIYYTNIYTIYIQINNSLVHFIKQFEEVAFNSEEEEIPPAPPHRCWGTPTKTFSTRTSSSSGWNVYTAVECLTGPGKERALLGFQKRQFYISAKGAKSQASVVIKWCLEACCLDFAFPGERVL